MARIYGFLAEVALKNLDWEEVEKFAQMALQIFDGSGQSHYVSSPEDYISTNSDRSLYLYLLAKVDINQDNQVNAIALLESAKNQISITEFEDNYPYFEILKELHEQYVLRKNHLKAVEVKQEFFSLEHQRGHRAFWGAGILGPQRDYISNFIQSEPSEIAVAIVSGRLKDLNNILSRIASTEFKLTILHGASGVGKSSLVKGGLVPALRQKAIGTRDNGLC